MKFTAYMHFHYDSVQTTESIGLNMELDLQSLFSLLCTGKTPQLPTPPHIWAHIRGRFWVSEDRIHLFVTPCYSLQ
jgi:hypothetical protein